MAQLVVPAGIESCNTPIAVVSGGTTRNVLTMSIAKAGTATCSDSVGLSAADLTNAQAKGKLTFGELYFENAWLSISGYGVSGFGNFYEASFDQLVKQASGVWTGNPGGSSVFSCYAKARDGQFTVP